MIKNVTCESGVTVPWDGDCPECYAKRGERCIPAALRERDEVVRLREFAAWVETWVSQPAGAFSVCALDGLFGMTRDKLAALQSQNGCSHLKSVQEE